MTSDDKKLASSLAVTSAGLAILSYAQSLFKKPVLASFFLGTAISSAVGSVFFYKRNV